MNSSLPFETSSFSLTFEQTTKCTLLYSNTSFSILCRYLAGDALDRDDSDGGDEDDDDDQPDKFEGSCDDETNESHQSKLDEMLATFGTRARSLQQERPRQVTPKFGNINQKPLEQTLPESQPQREDRQAFPCLQPGCNKICKSLCGLVLHVKRVHGAKTRKVLSFIFSSQLSMTFRNETGIKRSLSVLVGDGSTCFITFINFKQITK